MLRIGPDRTEFAASALSDDLNEASWLPGLPNVDPPGEARIDDGVRPLPTTHSASSYEQDCLISNIRGIKLSPINDRG
jgi:hypothetical protein